MGSSVSFTSQPSMWTASLSGPTNLTGRSCGLALFMTITPSSTQRRSCWLCGKEMIYSKGVSIESYTHVCPICTLSSCSFFLLILLAISHSWKDVMCCERNASRERLSIIHLCLNQITHHLETVGIKSLLYQHLVWTFKFTLPSSDIHLTGTPQAPVIVASQYLQLMARQEHGRGWEATCSEWARTERHRKPSEAAGGGAGADQTHVAARPRYHTPAGLPAGPPLPHDAPPRGEGHHQGWASCCWIV